MTLSHLCLHVCCQDLVHQRSIVHFDLRAGFFQQEYNTCGRFVQNVQSRATVWIFHKPHFHLLQGVLLNLLRKARTDVISMQLLLDVVQQKVVHLPGDTGFKLFPSRQIQNMHRGGVLGPGAGDIFYERLLAGEGLHGAVLQAEFERASVDDAAKRVQYDFSLCWLAFH